MAAAVDEIGGARMEQPPEHPHAPKGKPALARAALLKFGDSPASGEESDVADNYLKRVAFQYNGLALRGKHRAAVIALGRVSSTASAYADALCRLDKMLPGYLDVEALQRLPNGWRRPTVAGPLQTVRKLDGTRLNRFAGGTVADFERDCRISVLWGRLWRS